MQSWKAIETAPEGQWILFWGRADRPFAGSFTVLGMRKKGFIWDGHADQPVRRFTHWTPLPKPPGVCSHTANAAWRWMQEMKSLMPLF
jgi:hypothetical protein